MKNAPMSSMIEVLKLDYRNFQEERLPQVAVYSIFPKYVDKGMGRTFRFNLSNFIEEHYKRFVPLYDYVIVSEEKFLQEIEAGHFQAVRVAIPSSLSFHDLTFVVAGLHFDEFIKRHPWLSELRLMEMS